MKRQSSIWFITFTFIMILVCMFLYKDSYERNLSGQENESAPQEEACEECFYVIDFEGYVAVYLSDRETVYEYTSIFVSSLPEGLQEELQEGKKLDDLGEVYGFLENYSS